MKLAYFLLSLAVAATAHAEMAVTPLSLDDETTRINYSLGYQIGGDFKRQGFALDAAAVVRGIEDALNGAEPKLSPADMRETLVQLKRKVVAEERKRAAGQELERLAAGKKFLEANASRPGVKTTASGLQYRVLEPGSGRSPGPTDRVTVNYRGTLINGNEFDRSDADGSATFSLGGVIKGWTEGLQLIREGGRIELFVPPQLAYGDRGPLAHRTLIFEIELLSVGEAG